MIDVEQSRKNELDQYAWMVKHNPGMFKNPELIENWSGVITTGKPHMRFLYICLDGLEKPIEKYDYDRIISEFKSCLHMALSDKGLIDFKILDEPETMP